MNYLTLVAGTILIVIFSWFFSLKHRRYHGIPRFFVFESIFILFILNSGNWFSDPLSVNQVVSWILLILSAYAGITGFIILWTRGRAEGNFEATTVLVKSNIYKYIRHPLYLSLLLLGTGVMMKDPGVVQIILGGVVVTGGFITSKVEEGEMISRFGDAYRDYIKETKMFIPFVV